VVNPLPVLGLKQLLDAGRQLHLFDVRTKEEWDIAHIEGAVLLDRAGQQQLSALPKDAMIVMQCHHGLRSGQAAGQLVAAGYRNVFNLEGGIDAWSLEVDPGVPRY
jgi:monothiol glutaredoxin